MLEVKKEIREEVIDRDTWCQLCGADIQEVHHIFTRKAYPNLTNEKDNLICLCATCHKKFHKEPSKMIDWFKTNFKNRYIHLLEIKNLVKYNI